MPSDDLDDTAGSRIPPVEEWDGELGESLAKTLADDSGRPLNLFLTLGNHPRLLKRFNVFAGLFLAHGLLPARDRELVILRTAWRSGSAYEWGQHVLIGRAVGLSDEEIERVATASLDGWAERDEVLLIFTDELLADLEVSDATWERAAALLEQDQLVELILLAGHYRTIAGFLRTARVAAEDHLPGWPAGADDPGA